MAAIILKNGPEANRSSLSLQTGEVIFTTDTRRLYVGAESATTGLELTFNELSASFISASVIEATVISASAMDVGVLNVTVTSMSVQYLEVEGVIQGTSSWSETASFLLGSIESASYSLNSDTASFLLGSIESASYAVFSTTAEHSYNTDYATVSTNAYTASFLLGTAESASYSLFSETASLTNYALTSSYLSSSGQNVAIGDFLDTDGTTNTWSGNQDLTGSGIFVQRSNNTARLTLFSAGTTVDGNGNNTIAVSAGDLNSLSPTQQGHYGAWQLQTWGGSTWSTTARMLMQSGGDHTETSRPTDILFQSTPSGSTTLQTRLKVNGAGVQVTGSLGVAGSIGINASMVMAKKFVSLNTESFSTALTLNMEDDTATYVKVSLHGAWQGSGSAVYVGEFFLQKDDSNYYRQPGAIISQVNNNACGEILANLNTPTPGAGPQDLQLQFWASSSAMPYGDFLMLYEVRGQYNTVT